MVTLQSQSIIQLESLIHNSFNLSHAERFTLLSIIQSRLFDTLPFVSDQSIQKRLTVLYNYVTSVLSNM